jgi:TonB family protein
MPSLFRGEFEAARTGMAKGVSGAISVTTQVAIAAGVISVSGAVAPRVVKVPSQSLRFVSAVFLPPPPAELAPVPEEAVTRTIAPREVETPEPAPEVPTLVAVREFENNAPAPAAIEVRPAELSVRPAPPVPEPPKPIVGAFANSAAIAKSPEPTRRVESAGFDAPVAESPQSKLGAASVGAFATAATPGPQQRGAASNTHGAVAETGFNRPTAAVPTQAGRVIRDASFGSATSVERPTFAAASAGRPKTHHLPETRTAGFNDARIVEPVRRIESVPQVTAVKPVEVLSKPTPVYTDAARRQKIEGEVVLEVEFLASGSIRVLRVVRGLGYGLDESAAAAAQEIRFKPATSAGRAVDSRTTVQIVFRLA